MSNSIRLRIPKQTKITLNQMLDFSLIVFLCFPAFVFAINYFMRFVGLDGIGRTLSLMLVYVPLIFVAVRRKRVIYDFWVIWVAVVLFFLLTYIIHPEYEPWYTREEYGVLDYVLMPQNGLYIYLLLRHVNDPKRILRCVRLSSWPMYLYYALQIEKASERGYWIDYSNYGYEIHLSYNLSLGYSVLLFVLAFLYCALENKKVYDWIGAATGMALILLAGSRGPILDIIIFLILYFAVRLGKSRKKVFTMVGVAAVGVLFYFVYPYLLAGASIVLNRFNISSRFLEKLLNGTISDDAGRLIIWKAAVNMIKENPWGYGAMGSRHVISKYVYVGHPHNIFLELLIDFGVIFGTVIIIWLLYWAIKLLATKGNDEWKGVFLVFFSRACQLLLSLTFWHSIGLWGALAIGACMWRACKKRRYLNVI